MKSYDQPKAKQAEIAQLILLESLYTLRESREVCFQGGTAIRWFYGGMRFSEDLDFVTSLSRERVVALMKSAGEAIRRQMVANFGAGTFTLKEKKGHPSFYKAFIQFQPAAVRSKISVKIEFEKLVPGVKPDAEPKIMQASPTVAHFLQEGGFKTPGASVIVNVETVHEILSDKLRALLERPYKKGRDFFDVWFLTKTLRIDPDASMLKRKLDMYEVPFTVSTPFSFYTRLESLKGKARQSLTKDIHQELARFLNTETVEILSNNDYDELILAVQNTFRKVEAKGIIDFSLYRTRKQAIL